MAVAPLDDGCGATVDGVRSVRSVVQCSSAHDECESLGSIGFWRHAVFTMRFDGNAQRSVEEETHAEGDHQHGALLVAVLAGLQGKPQDAILSQGPVF